MAVKGLNLPHRAQREGRRRARRGGAGRALSLVPDVAHLPEPRQEAGLPPLFAPH